MFYRQKVVFLETSGRHIHVNAEIANQLVTFIFLRVKVAYCSFSKTQLRALRNSLLCHFFRGCNTLLHHREKAENTSESWLVKIARGVP